MTTLQPTAVFHEHTLSSAIQEELLMVHGNDATKSALDLGFSRGKLEPPPRC